MEDVQKNRVPIPKEQLHASTAHSHHGHSHGILHLHGQPKEQNQSQSEKYREIPVEDRPHEPIPTKAVKITVGRTFL